jgi:pimeloyl-ACP methyl ester carboxylesterase
VELQVGGRRVFAGTGGRDFDPALPTIVFLHGAGMDHTVWALQTRWFAHHGRGVLALDLPGHGRSEGPALRLIGEMADFVLATLDAAEATRAALIGHSMGALIALETAARGAGRIAALALLGMAPVMPVHPDLLAAAAKGEHSAVELMVSWAVGRKAQLGANEAPGLWLTGAALRLLERADAASLAGDLAACDAYNGAAEAVAKAGCPMLMLLGADDRMTPPGKARDLATQLRDTRAVTLPRVGHMMMLEDPSGTLAALKTIV